jgi:hypothetical protein
MATSIIYRVKVDSGLTIEQAIERYAPYRRYRELTQERSDFFKTVPKNASEETDVYFFRVAFRVNDDDLEKEYERRGLRPVDPYSLAQINIDDRRFSHDRPNGTHWKDAEGKWCLASFNHHNGHDCVDIYRGDSQWGPFWWFAGVRSSATKANE